MGEKGKNIVLIGMPGCGKTSVGKGLAEKLDMRFCDIDEYIEKKMGKKIKEIFISGEEFFRKLERDAVKDVSSFSNTVISTGGGVVLCSENMENLKKNGVVFFINRPLEKIAEDLEISSRPLLADGIHRLYQLFRERYSLYKKYSDFEIISKNGISETVDKIIKCWRKGL